MSMSTSMSTSTTTSSTSLSLLWPLGVVVLVVATAYQGMVILLQDTLSAHDTQETLAVLFRSSALVVLPLFLAMPGQTFGSSVHMNLATQVGLFLLIVGAPGYELLVHIHQSRGRQETIEALEQEGRMLACAICGFCTVVFAQVTNWFLNVTSEPPMPLPKELNDDPLNSNRPRKSSESSNSADGSMNGGRSGMSMSISGTDISVGSQRLPRRESMPSSAWWDVVTIGQSDLVDFMEAEGCWQEVHLDKDDVEVWRRPEALIEGGVPPIKVSGLVAGVDPYALCTCFQSADFKRASSPTVKELRVVEEINENTKIYYQEDQYPWPMSNRDSVFISTVFELPDEDSIVLAEWSMPSYTHADVPSASSQGGRIRVQTYRVVKFSRYGDTGDSVLTVASNIDVGGSIPRFVVEEEVRKLPRIFEEVRMLLESEPGQETFQAVTNAVNRALWTDIVVNDLSPLQRNFLEHNCKPYTELIQKYVAPASSLAEVIANKESGVNGITGSNGTIYGLPNGGSNVSLAKESGNGNGGDVEESDGSDCDDDDSDDGVGLVTASLVAASVVTEVVETAVEDKQ